MLQKKFGKVVPSPAAEETVVSFPHSWCVKHSCGAEVTHLIALIHIYLVLMQNAKKIPDANEKKPLFPWANTDLRTAPTSSLPWASASETLKESTQWTWRIFQVSDPFSSISSLKSSTLSPQNAHCSSDKELQCMGWFFTAFWIASRCLIDLSASCSPMLHFFSPAMLQTSPYAEKVH